MKKAREWTIQTRETKRDEWEDYERSSDADYIRRKLKALRADGLQARAL